MTGELMLYKDTKNSGGCYFSSTKCADLALEMGKNSNCPVELSQAATTKQHLPKLVYTVLCLQQISSVNTELCL